MKNMGRPAILTMLLCLVLAWGMAAPALADDAPPILALEPVAESFTAEQDGLDNDALLDAYVQRMIDASLNLPDRKPLLRSSGALLTGINRAIYDILKDRVSRIAAGTVTSTEISITKAELLQIDPSLDLGPWTANDLGVSAIVVNGSISGKAVEAAEAKLKFDFHKIMNALLADCPYELYWYDKTLGTQYAMFGAQGTQEVWRLTFSDPVWIRMRVSQGYASADYTVDASRINSVNTAIQNAQGIVGASASLGGSVYSRLLGYKNSICDAVSYNDDAVTGDDVPYGDPWQLVYVFDNDRSTNVVCEGYSKAFKYLFDLSGFDGSYDCILATGTMSGGSGAGAHMWNLVRMEDGQNYLVDVTNCDAGTIGYPDELFMAAGPSGTWDNWYTFRIGTQQISYAYDSETRMSFDQSMLEVSAAAYNPAPLYTVSVNNENGGSVTASPAQTAAGNTVTLTVNPSTGCQLAPNGLRVTYTDGNNTTQTVDLTQGTGDKSNEWTFTMPPHDVAVTARWVPVFGTPDFILPSAVINIEESAFEGFAATVVYIPDGCQSIGKWAFRSSQGLTQIRLPANCAIDDTAFAGCTSLIAVYAPAGGTVEDWCANQDILFVAEQ